MSDNGLNNSWIYIVLTIVIAVIGTLRKSKKSADPTQIPIPRREESSEYPTEWDKEEGYTNPEYIDNKVEQTIVEGKQDRNIGGLRKSLLTEEEPEVREMDLKEGFDLKKAIIYNEILNRKY